MSPTISRTAVLASASVVAASALVFGAVAAASAAPQPRIATAPSSSTATATETSASTDGKVYADITVTLERTIDDWTRIKVLGVKDVEVGDGVELDYSAGGTVIDNTAELCGGISVDVSLDPKSIEIYEDDQFSENSCDFTKITVVVTLDGDTFGTVTVGSDDLFSEPFIKFPDDEEPELIEAFGLSSKGTFRFSRSVITALSAPFPTLASTTVSGSTFTAVWEGSQPANIVGGSAVFNFAAPATPVTPTTPTTPTAPAATPVLATPVFTG